MRFTYNALRLLLIQAIALGCLAGCEDNVLPVITDGYAQYGTPFDQVPATSDIIMYEVNLRAYSAGGDLQGVIAGLDHIQNLSINTVWLMPIYDEGILNAVNSPYCIRDFKTVSSEYGTLTDLRQLVDEAHARNMTVILDWVANHTSWDNNWITEHPDWYTQDGSGNIIHPPGTTWTDVADLNFDNNDMRAAMIDAMKFWVLTANVDGYRCDYADGVPFDFWQQAIDSLRSIPNRDIIMLAEGDRADHYTAGFDMTYSWDYYGTMQNVFNGSPAYNLYTTNINEYTGMPAGKEKLRFTTNHDESAWNATPMTLFDGAEGAVAASVMTIFLEGVPLIYTGQEVGRETTVSFFSNTPINWTAHPDMLTQYQDMLEAFATHDVASKGTLTTFSNNDVFCIKKVLDTQEMAVLVNARNTSITYTLPTPLKNTDWTDAITGSSYSLLTSVTLSPYQYLILTH
jgi:glycosidase